MHVAYIIGLSINKDLKLKKRKGKDKQQHEKLYTITWLYKGYITSASTIISTITAVFINAIILSPPLKKPALRLCIFVLYL